MGESTNCVQWHTDNGITSPSSRRQKATRLMGSVGLQRSERDDYQLGVICANSVLPTFMTDPPTWQSGEITQIRQFAFQIDTKIISRKAVPILEFFQFPFDLTGH